MVKPTKRLYKSLTHMGTFSQWEPHEDIVKRLEGTCFGHLVGLKPVKQDIELLTFLVKQYDTKEGSFLLGSEKVYVSLIDILYIIGLPIEGRPVTGCEVHGSETCLEYLGKNGCNGTSSNVKLSWLRENFKVLPDNPTEEVRDQYSRAYLLYMLGTLFFQNRSGTNVSVIFLPLLGKLDEVHKYAWGAAVLSYLHAGLCGTKDLNTVTIPACTMILQIFVLEHYPLVAKRYLEKYFPNLNNDSLPKRFPIFKEWMDFLDAPSKNNHLKIDLKAELRNEETNKVDYTPYQRLEPSYLPEILRSHRGLCLSQTVLICFEKAKYHLPHLSMWLKTLDIPKDSCKGFRKIPLKNTSRRGSKGRDYRILLAKAIAQWDKRWQNRLKNIEPPISNNFLAFLAKKSLLVLDLNGILVDMVEKYDKSFHPDSKIRMKNVFLRQHCESFLKFCFEKFEVAIWTSRMRHNLESLIDNHFQNYRKRFLFIWDYDNCTNAKSFPHSSKPVLLKKIRKVWQAYPQYDESNTLLIDDSPYKALCNPEGTTIFPRSYCYKNKYNDASLGEIPLLSKRNGFQFVLACMEKLSPGPDGDLRVYLENVAKATNVREYVEKNRLGLPPISNERPDGELQDYLENLAKDTNYRGVAHEKSRLDQPLISKADGLWDFFLTIRQDESEKLE